jgi:hypothetical protein
MLIRIAALLLLTSAVIVYAHTNEYLDTIDGMHGGQLRMSGPYHFELLAAPGDLVVFVTDHADNPISTANGKASALVNTVGKKVNVPLLPAGDNSFHGRARFTLDERSTVHLKVTILNASPELATFQPMRKRKKPDAHQEHRKHH